MTFGRTCDLQPVRMLGAIDQRQLDELSQDDGFLAIITGVSKKYERVYAEQKWHEKNFGKKETYIAYFSG